MRKSETALVKRIIQAIRLNWRRTFLFKVHGSPFQLIGLPDIIGCIEGRFVGIEVKVPGKVPTRIQRYRLKQIRRAGGIGIWADSVEKAIERLQRRLPVRA